MRPIHLHEHLGPRHQIGQLSRRLLARGFVELQRLVRLLPALIDHAAEIFDFGILRIASPRSAQLRSAHSWRKSKPPASALARKLSCSTEPLRLR